MRTSSTFYYDVELMSKVVEGLLEHEGVNTQEESKKNQKTTGSQEVFDEKLNPGRETPKALLKFWKGTIPAVEPV